MIQEVQKLSENRRTSSLGYASGKPRKQGCHYITRCNIDFTLQLHLTCDIDIYIAIVLHVAMSHDVATFLLTWASYRLVLELQRVRRARQAA